MSYNGTEVFYEELEYHAKELPGGLTDFNLVKAAKEIRSLCDGLGLEIVALLPFASYGGLIDRKEHAGRIQQLHLWFQLAKELRTDTIQILANFKTEGVTGDHELIAADIRELADLGLKETPVVRFAYENICWVKHVNTWEHAWEIVTAVDRSNFGLCLDTFHIAGKVWADPSRADGRVPDGDELLRESLQRMVKTVDLAKVFYVQVVDGERLDAPMRPGHSQYIEGEDSRMWWSRNARVFPFEEEGYMPVLDVLKAITDPKGLNYKGWISFELFSQTMAEPGCSVPHEHAARAAISRQRLAEAMK